MENTGIYTGIFLHFVLVWVVCALADHYLE